MKSNSDRVTLADQQEAVLGVDIGTSATKAVLVALDGAIIASARREHRLDLPRPGWAEHDAERVWWDEFVSVCRELAPRAGGGLRAIGVSGIGPCVVPCDAGLRPLRPAIMYGVDTRAANEIAELEHRLGAEAVLARCGSALSAQALGPKLLWLARNEPDVWAACTGWYMASSFIAGRLTGAYVLDHHSASQCDPLYDLDQGRWADDWVQDILGPLPMPELVCPSEQVGRVSSAAAEATGLPAGTPVVAGTIDAWAEAFSAGVRRPGDLMLMYGSTMFFVQVVETSTRHPLLWTTQGIERDSLSLAAGMSTSGSLTEWVRKLAGDPPWETLLAEAAASPPGSRGLLLLPYFAGERTPIHDPLARGVLAGLTLRHERGDLLRAVYEATAYGTRQILELFAAAGDPPRRAVAVGGGTNADLWLQIVSDVTGITQQVPAVTIGASHGAALLAAIGAGLVEPDTDWSRRSREVTPALGNRALYDERSRLYGDLYAETADTVHQLTG
jgi:xylulokinase